jgi:hypothetical protein
MLTVHKLVPMRRATRAKFLENLFIFIFYFMGFWCVFLQNYFGFIELKRISGPESKNYLFSSLKNGIF